MVECMAITGFVYSGPGRLFHFRGNRQKKVFGNIQDFTGGQRGIEVVLNLPGTCHHAQDMRGIERHR